jgi:hypothetical protein
MSLVSVPLVSDKRYTARPGSCDGGGPSSSYPLTASTPVSLQEGTGHEPQDTLLDEGPTEMCELGILPSI